MQQPRTAAPPAGATCAHQHLVEFYETDAFLIGTVADFAVPALRDWDSVIIVATPEHRQAFADEIGARGIDLQAAERDGRYQAFDAAEVLSTFMVGGAPDRDLFEEAAGSLIDRAAADARHVKVYGEMVALLLAAGDVLSAIALEDFWNDLAQGRDFSLLCAYPLEGFDTADRGVFRRICEQHSTVIPAEAYTLATTADEQERVVAALQQENAALRTELRRRRHRAVRHAAASLPHA
ncbi:MAG: hypothetical protein QOE11_785 [Solirubrobacteraceae bacterium]|jgi:hypothetical protein|nr:hypothetical protein [Solirubrobacteraceae bacterium]